jgi:NADH:ubiquinone oxidoreductase subunit K
VEVGLNHYLILSGILFSIGLFGALAKRNVVAMLMALEIMFNAVNLAMVAFSRFVTPPLLTGQVFALFIITVAAAEVSLGLGIIIALYRVRDTVDATEASILRG